MRYLRYCLLQHIRLGLHAHQVRAYLMANVTPEESLASGMSRNSLHVMCQVDVYSFSMIAYQLFELTPPFSGMDPVDAARKAALAEERPPLMRLATQMPTMKVCAITEPSRYPFVATPVIAVRLHPMTEGLRQLICMCHSDRASAVPLASWCRRALETGTEHALYQR